MKIWEKILVLALPLSQVFLVALVVITKTDFVIYLLPVVAALVVGYYTVLIRDVLRRYRGSNEKAGWIIAMLFFWPAGLIYFFMFYSPIATHKKEEKMNNKRTNRHPIKSAGFTLIEILLVVIILGILTSLVAIKLTGKTEDAQVAATKANINTIKVAISQYEMDTGKLPKNLKDLVQEEKHYLDRETVPQDEWGNDFKYYMKGDLVKIRSAGPDGSFDTEDDIVNE